MLNYILDTNDFIRIIHNHDEVILFSSGEEGNATLNFLRYANYIDRICCIASIKNDDINNVAQKLDHDLPVIPLEHLMHFRESGVLIVAVPSKLCDTIDNSLTKLGFKKVLFLKEETIRNIQGILNNLLSSGQAMFWFMNHFTKKLTELEYRIEEQNELCAVNTKAFSEYRNCFRGKKVVLFASGPTAKQYNPLLFPSTDEVVHIGVNFSWRREDVLLDYLFINDGRLKMSKEIAIESGFDRIREKIFVGRYSKTSPYNWLELSENFSLESEKFCRYYSNAANFNQTLYKDIRYHGLADFASVIFPAMHFALFTYPKELYLVGCDTSHSGYFHEAKSSSSRKNKLNIRKLKVGYSRMKMFARQYYPDTEIISINPVGLKGLFRDVYTSDEKIPMSDG